MRRRTCLDPSPYLSRFWPSCIPPNICYINPPPAQGIPSPLSILDNARLNLQVHPPVLLHPLRLAPLRLVLLRQAPATHKCHVPRREEASRTRIQRGRAHRFPLADMLDKPQLGHRPNSRFRSLRHPRPPGCISCFYLYTIARRPAQARLHPSTDAADGPGPLCIRSRRTRLLRLCSRSNHPRICGGLDASDGDRVGFRPRVLRS